VQKDTKRRRRRKRERNSKHAERMGEESTLQSLLGWLVKRRRMKMHVSLSFSILYACICVFEAYVVLKKIEDEDEEKKK
jgi:hypothetical protein